MLFCTFRVNKRPTNVSVDDWFVKCYENGMDHRLNRLLNPQFNNKNMEVRYCFLAGFRLKLTKNGLFFVDTYIFLNFPGLRLLSRRWKSSKNPTVTDRQTKYNGALRYVNKTTSQNHVVYSQKLIPLLIHNYLSTGTSKIVAWDQDLGFVHASARPQMVVWKGLLRYPRRQPKLSSQQNEA